MAPLSESQTQLAFCVFVSLGADASSLHQDVCLQDNHSGFRLLPSGTGPVPTATLHICVSMQVRVCVFVVCVFVELHLSSHSFPFLGSINRLKLKRQGSPPRPSFVLLLAPNLGNSWGGHGDDLSPSARPLDRLRACTHTHKYSLGKTRTLTNSRIYTQLNIQSV